MSEELETRILEIEVDGETGQLARALEAVLELHARHTAFDGNLDYCPVCVKSEGATYPCLTVSKILEVMDEV